MKICDSIAYVGVNDHDIDLFEGQYDVRENGMSYNSYVVLGSDKVAVTDTVDAHFVDEWLANVEAALAGRTPDYLVVHHMEPDHSAGIAAFMERYPAAQVVASAAAFKMMVAYFGTDFADRKIVAKEGFELELGDRSLTFVGAPNVHWPEVLFSYDAADKTLFSADAFGKFDALDVEDPEGWACEARRYYFGIVGKFGKNVQAVLKKAAALDIERICPLHGPVLDENLGYYLGLYNTWSSYEPEDEGVTIAYSSVYGNTRAAALALADALKGRGVAASTFDLARDDMAKAVEDAFRYDRLVLASITYAGSIFPHMSTFIHTLAEHAYQNRRVALIESGSWAPTAAKVMRAELEQMKGIEVADTVVTVRGALDDASRAQIEALADELAAPARAE
ncbi:FprA family A-type flavoprotein [uncultured Parolsenella sp.]|uniref:FprA family A-type flavoprotein n=1 Tax=uncultured Parolsenella sp. TaxID=2083008 RepID=UPI0025D02EE3|nr:FprA family A-type flavoprotein [uncultured Parolsenella sp.]